MYVIKVGEYYVRKYVIESLDVCILLSKELMRGFSKVDADRIAKQLNGEVFEVQDQVTMWEDETND